MKINTGIGRENLIDHIVYLRGNERGEYSELALYELAIAKLQAGLV